MDKSKYFLHATRDEPKNGKHGRTSRSLDQNRLMKYLSFMKKKKEKRLKTVTKIANWYSGRKKLINLDEEQGIYSKAAIYFLGCKYCG